MSELNSQGVRSLHDRLDHIQRLVEQTCVHPGELTHVNGTIEHVIPAWKRRTIGETRWQVALCTAIAIALQVAVPGRLALVRPTWILPAVQAVLLIALIVANPNRITKQSMPLRIVSLTLMAILSFANAWSVVSLTIGLVRGTEGQNAGPLLISGGAIWLTNIVVFGLWYWEFDRGGPAERAAGTHQYPDFMFPQMATPQLAPPDWEPGFPDYLYLAFTNASAFSPTDVMPLSRWAKLAMTIQSIVSIVTVALIVARAVNILK
jgi:uncharacterized membrane protein